MSLQVHVNLKLVSEPSKVEWDSEELLQIKIYKGKLLNIPGNFITVYNERN